MIRHAHRWIPILLVLALLAGACAPATPAPAPAKKEFTFYIVSHGGPTAAPRTPSGAWSSKG